MPKMAPEWDFSSFDKNLIHTFLLEYNSTRKIKFLSYGPQNFRPIIMHYSWNLIISQTSRGMNLILCMWIDIYRRNKLNWSFQVDLVRHDWAYPKLGQIMSELHLKNELSYNIGSSHVLRGPQMLQISYWMCSGMSKLIKNN